MHSPRACVARGSAHVSGLLSHRQRFNLIPPARGSYLNPRRIRGEAGASRLKSVDDAVGARCRLVVVPPARAGLFSVQPGLGRTRGRVWPRPGLQSVFSIVAHPVPNSRKLIRSGRKPSSLAHGTEGARTRSVCVRSPDSPPCPVWTPVAAVASSDAPPSFGSARVRVEVGRCAVASCRPRRTRSHVLHAAARFGVPGEFMTLLPRVHWCRRTAGRVTMLD